MTDLSPRARDILSYIHRQGGRTPSIREIGDAVGLTSTCSTHRQVQHLCEQGYLVRSDGYFRTLGLGRKGRALFAETATLSRAERIENAARDLAESLAPMLAKVTAYDSLVKCPKPRSARWKVTNDDYLEPVAAGLEVLRTVLEGKE